MRRFAAVLLPLLALSCRDIQPVASSVATQGYRLDGVVTSANGLVLSGVDVRLYYTYEYESSTPIDTQSVIVHDSIAIVDVAVYTPKLAFVRQLFLGYRAPGPVPRYPWDGKDEFGALVPSGKYLVRYVVDTTIVKYSTDVVDGHVTATTDRNGAFTLTTDRFPIGQVFDAYFSTGDYDATYKVLPAVDLSLRKGSLFKVYTNINLSQNYVTTITMTLE